MSFVDYKFRSSKLDQTPYLFHFTKGNLKEAKDNLYSILQSQILRSKLLEYICFTASPITSLHSFFNVSVNRTGLPMYQPYGIGFHRDILIKEFDARNVIYSSEEEILNFPKDLYWRCQQLEVDQCDFEYLREWRIKGKTFDFSAFPREHILVIAPTLADVHDLVVGQEEEPVVMGNPITGDVYVDTQIVYPLCYKALPLDKIKMLYNNDYQVFHESKSQVLFENKEEDLIKELRIRSSKYNKESN